MKGFGRAPRPAWGKFDARPGRWAPLLLLFPIVGLLLAEVWQSSRVAELSMQLTRTRAAVDESRAHLEFLRADLDKRTTRSTLAPVAERLGLRPAEAQQVVLLPAAYLAAAEEPERERATPAWLAVTEKIARVLVPDARARARGNR